MEIKISTKFQDVVWANIWLSVLKPSILIGIILLSFYCVFKLYGSYDLSCKGYSTKVWYMWVLFWASMGGIFFIMLILATLFSFINLLRKGSIGNQTITLTADSLIEHDGYNENVFPWKKIKHIENTKRYIFIKISSFKYLIISKYNFETYIDFIKFYLELLQFKNSS